MQKNIIWFENLRITDIDKVGGKNASLGEMISQLSTQNICVPGGFASTAYAYSCFLEHNNLKEQIDNALNNIDIDDIIMLSRISRQIQGWILKSPLPKVFEDEISLAYTQMLERYGNDLSVAVRSSATAEDLPDASFAGQQDSLLNVVGIDNVKSAIKHVFASLYNDRAIAYRVHKKFDHSSIQMSVGIQKMVRSDIASSGVMFTIDTESGFDQVVFITSSYGLGECIVQGMVNPDEFYVYKPSLLNNKTAIIRKNIGSKIIKMQFSKNTTNNKSVETINNQDKLCKTFSISDEHVTQLAKLAVIIENHYQKPMDIEWALDGLDNKLYILQARPETVKSQEKYNNQIRYTVEDQVIEFSNEINGHSHTKEIIVTGRAVGQKAAHGVVRIIDNINQMHKIQIGDILVTDMTDPDWEPIMKKAAAIVTNRGGRTCHAAIIARELGIPAIVGCEYATSKLKDGMLITVSCCEGDTGYVYHNKLKIEVKEVTVKEMPKLPIKIMMNIGNPELAFNFRNIPNCGVGLARLEFIINKQIGIHPKALLEYDSLPSQLKEVIKNKIIGYQSPVNFYVDKLAEGIATIAAAFYPEKVIVRLSDFKSNEYSNLIGGTLYEPTEENPMMGFRGAARYISPNFRECFELECMAINKVRNQMGFTNIAIMIPFIRTVKEAAQVIDLLKENGLERGKYHLAIYMMCEIPANAILAAEFLQYFDGFSIGSNDMTQLTLGIDRDSNGAIAASFDERNDAVKSMLSLSIQACKKLNKYVGICGQGPSDHPDFAKWLIDEGIDTISLNPDTVVKTWLYLADPEEAKG